MMKRKAVRKVRDIEQWRGKNDTININTRR